ncbi:TrmH family RNA methyltransferase [Ruania zhangjianzhongii]|uniref:TrmH family RNA methyltransferase n=1 Tax=Ruania zhangjianzhongii TaxID=2603206 RepID=UPI0011CAFEF3|nr:RNA methyltransferase [Ruania zhangjianzhongii]
MANPRADRVRAVAALARASVRTRRGQFRVEGPQAVREAVRFAPELVRDVYLSVAAAQRYPEITDDASTAGVHTHLCSPDVLTAMSPDAQGVLAVARPDEAAAADLFSSGRPPQLLAALAQVRDPGNAGTVIRAADAAGADGVLLSAGSVDRHNPKVVRSTAGSLFHLPVIPGVDLAEATAAARSAGMQVLAADGAGQTGLDDADLARPTLWVFGNEAHGLGAAERELADAVVRIPIHGHAESLNLAMAATVCLYSSARALQAS